MGSFFESFEQSELGSFTQSTIGNVRKSGEFPWDVLVAGSVSGSDANFVWNCSKDGSKTAIGPGNPSGFSSVLGDAMRWYRGELWAEIANEVYRLRAGKWQKTTGGIPGNCYGLQLSPGGSLYTVFGTSGATPTGYIYRWNGSSWGLMGGNPGNIGGYPGNGYPRGLGIKQNSQDLVVSNYDPFGYDLVVSFYPPGFLLAGNIFATLDSDQFSEYNGTLYCSNSRGVHYYSGGTWNRISSDPSYCVKTLNGKLYAPLDFNAASADVLVVDETGFDVQSLGDYNNLYDIGYDGEYLVCVGEGDSGGGVVTWHDPSTFTTTGAADYRLDIPEAFYIWDVLTTAGK